GGGCPHETLLNEWKLFDQMKRKNKREKNEGNEGVKVERGRHVVLDEVCSPRSYTPPLPPSSERFHIIFMLKESERKI
ncbi:Hypothetical protein SMAX5B_007204, partial [Scophthalmus maximus]